MEVIKLKFKDFKSVKNWFTKRNGEKRYKPTTEEAYIDYLKLFCNVLKTSPDKLANVSSEEAVGIQQTLASIMKSLNLRDLSITQRINALHSFWRYNGVFLNEKIMTYSGIPWLMMQRIKR
jgi:site-specific recombinase XerD